MLASLQGKRSPWRAFALSAGTAANRHDEGLVRVAATNHRYGPPLLLEWPRRQGRQRGWSKERTVQVVRLVASWERWE